MRPPVTINDKHTDTLNVHHVDIGPRSQLQQRYQFTDKGESLGKKGELLDGN